ncbi:hypothetical protein CPB85DRAFT_1254037 [Mucidula mucida]|nr:hypothetical protein CPB85DRAFT_1254037 [Mucidula mucida]
MSTYQLVLPLTESDYQITGVTGFLATHVVDQALKAGLTVRGTVRSAAKLVDVKKRWPGTNFDAVVVPDLVTGDYTEALKGTLKVMKAAHKAGVTRIVLTASIAGVDDPTKGGFIRDYTYTATDWNPLTYEMALSGNLPGLGTYAVSKTLAEKAAWDFVKAHPEIKLTAINHVVLVISGTTEVPKTGVPLFVDVRDAARAHVLALKNDAVIGQRVLLNGGSYTFYQIVKLLQQKRPELASRLPSLEGVEDEPGPFARVDTAIAEKTLGMQFLSFEESFLDTIDSLVAIENADKARM